MEADGSQCPAPRPRRSRRRGRSSPRGSGARRSRVLRVVGGELGAELLADLADRAARAQRLAHRGEEILGAGRDPAHLAQSRGGRLGVALGAHARRPLELALLRRGVEPMQLDRFVTVLREAVDADDDARALLDLLRIAERRVLDLALNQALLNRLDRAADLVHPLDEVARALLQ